MYTIYVVFKSVPGKREEYIEKLYNEGIVDEIRKEDGCIKYEYYFSEKDENEILLIEYWETKEKQQIHLTMPHMDKMRAIKADYIVSTELGEFSFNN